MFVVRRESIPSIHEVEVDGTTHFLGCLKDLRKSPEIARHLPEQARLSISWVRLRPGELLEAHRHPTTSMIVVTEGRGRVTGDTSGEIRAGDTVIVPPGALHGFAGEGEEGFWALSMQFEGQALYEDLSNPRVRFEKDRQSGIERSLGRLIDENERFLKRYRAGRLCELVRSDLARRDDVRARLIDHLQPWSNAFQRVLFARAAFGTGREFQLVAERHVAEEVGHNHLLGQMRGGTDESVWDPVVSAASSWFVEQMLSLGELEQTVLVHFVLEGSGEIFHKEAMPLFPDSKHFALHGSVDEDHFKMGIELLKKQADLDVDRLSKVLRKGWAMMELLSDRIAEVAAGGLKA
jgi:quercetin dioxygenase-like cupin family protein